MRSCSGTSLLSLFFTYFLLYSSVFASVLPQPNDLSQRSVLEYKSYSNRVTPREANPLTKRDKTPPVPTVEDCKAHLTVPKDKSVFYSSAVQKSAEAWAAANEGTTIWTAGLTAYQSSLTAQIKQAMQDGVETWDPLADGDQFFINCSKAFALLATGEVTAVLPPGSDGNPSMPAESFFTLYEWPILQDPSQTPDVTAITAYAGNPDGSAPSGDGQQLCRNS